MCHCVSLMIRQFSLYCTLTIITSQPPKSFQWFFEIHPINKVVFADADCVIVHWCTHLVQIMKNTIIAPNPTAVKHTVKKIRMQHVNGNPPSSSCLNIPFPRHRVIDCVILFDSLVGYDESGYGSFPTVGALLTAGAPLERCSLWLGIPLRVTLDIGLCDPAWSMAWFMRINIRKIAQLFRISVSMLRTVFGVGNCSTFSLASSWTPTG